MAKSTVEKIVSASARRPWLTILTWVIIIAIAGYLIATRLSDALTTSQEFTNQPESQQAADLRDKYFPDQPKAAELVIVHSSSTRVTDTAYQAFVDDLAKSLAENPHVFQVVSYYQFPNPSLVSADQTALLMPVTLEGELTDQEKYITEILEIIHQKRNQTFDVKVIGPASISQNFTEVSESDLRTGETYGLPITVLILLIVFGAVVAALLPLTLSIIAILAAIGTTAFVGTAFNPVSFFVVNMITMMGLAVGIDYSLFVVSRFREERQNGKNKNQAIAIAGATAGKAVLFSGLTVVLGLLGLFIIPMNIFQGLATGAVFVVIFAVLAALTLLPAMLSLLGDRINLLKIGWRRPKKAQSAQSGFWYKLTKRILARPVASLLAAVALLILMALPALRLDIGGSGIGSMPESLEARQAFDLLEEKFGVGSISPGFAVVEADLNNPAATEAVANLQQKLADNLAFGQANVQINEAKTAALIQFPINAEGTSNQAQDAIEELRQTTIPTVFEGTDARVLVGGEAAGNFDFVAITNDYALPVFAFVLGLSLVLLMVVFRSIIVPIKAVIMNLLSVAAAYGLLVLVFQEGIGAKLLGFQQVEKIEAWLPLFLFCVLFGLSMDYHVFLLSRIREHFTKTKNNTEAVAFGVRSTASIITGAALIMVAVFAAFAAGDLVMFQQMGFGMAVAILLDATIVRSVLVPASMQLLGERNWYLPKWLGWLPRVNIE